MYVEPPPLIGIPSCVKIFPPCTNPVSSVLDKLKLTTPVLSVFLILMTGAVVGAFLILLAVVLVLVLLPELRGLLTIAFRTDDPNSYSRFSIWYDMSEIAMKSEQQIIFGGGFLFIQDIYGSPYNAFLRILFNQGLLFLGISTVTLVILAILAFSDPVPLRRRLCLALFAYWMLFSMFLDTWFAEFFHFTEFCFWFACALATTRSFPSRIPQRFFPADRRDFLASPV